LALVIAALAAVPVVGYAEDLYVSDQLETTLRAGPGTNYKIIEMLISGAALTKLEEAEGWARVRTQGHKEGGVLTRHLTKDPPKGPLLAAAQKDLEALRAQNGQVRSELDSANAEKNRLSEELKRVRGRLETVERELAAWKTANQDVVALGVRAAALEQEQTAARAELDDLRTENRALQAREKFYWFFSGVVVLLLGWGLGYVYSSSRHRAKNQSRFRF
jgi:SH3 domain protein